MRDGRRRRGALHGGPRGVQGSPRDHRADRAAPGRRPTGRSRGEEDEEFEDEEPEAEEDEDFDDEEPEAEEDEDFDDEEPEAEEPTRTRRTRTRGRGLRGRGGARGRGGRGLRRRGARGRGGRGLRRRRGRGARGRRGRGARGRGGRGLRGRGARGRGGRGLRRRGRHDPSRPPARAARRPSRGRGPRPSAERRSPRAVASHGTHDRTSTTKQDEADRYRRAAEDALQQLDWAIGYLHGIRKIEISRALAKNRSHIRTQLLGASEQPIPASRPTRPDHTHRGDDRMAAVAHSPGATSSARGPAGSRTSSRSSWTRASSSTPTSASR